MSGKGKTALSLLAAILLPMSGGIAGSVSVAKSFSTWYQVIRKPSWTPPSWVFGPVWTTLYTLMGIASWLVWRKWSKENKGVSKPAALYGTQLVLNWIWTPIFFGLHAPGWALAEIVLMWSTILATMIQFFRTDKRAGAMLVPYQIWVSIATALNAAVWWLNRPGTTN